MRSYKEKEQKALVKEISKPFSNPSNANKPTAGTYSFIQFQVPGSKKLVTINNKPATRD
jgi:hypothetical protein